MYRVLIVDDELIVREGLKQFVKWNELGFEVVGEASNGEKAFELVYDLKPHVVLTDIKMPVCTGIELMKKIKQTGIETSIIILSGYDEFDYAKAALEVGAVDYILKPPDLVKLTEILTKLKLDFEKKSILDRQVTEALNILRDKFLLKLAAGTLSRNELSEGTQKYNLVFDSDGYNTMIIQAGDEHKELFFDLSVKKDIEKICSGYGKGYAFENNDEGIAVIAGSSNIVEDIASVAAEIKQYFDSRPSKITATICIGSPANEVLQICKSYEAAKKTLELKFALGNDRIIFPEDINGLPKQEAEENDSLENKFLCLLQAKDLNGLRALVSHFLTAGAEKEAAYRKYRFLENILRKYLEKIDIRITDMPGEKCLNHKSMPYKETVNDLGSSFVDLCEKVFGYMDSVNKKVPNKLVRDIQCFVKENIGKDISLEIIADRFNMHPMYVSKAFKKETAMNFIDYITNVRIQKARELMYDTNDKNYEISKKVGYYSPKHFSRVFKSVTGVTPKEYRKYILGLTDGGNDHNEAGV